MSQLQRRSRGDSKSWFIPFAHFQNVGNYPLKLTLLANLFYDWTQSLTLFTWLLVPKPLLTVDRKYLALTPRTRIIIGLGVMAYAGSALYLSDRAEDTFNLKATEEEKKRLDEMIPKIRAVDRPEST